MKQSSWLLLFFVFVTNNLAWGSDWSIEVGKLTPSESVKLLEENPDANPESYSIVNIHYLDKNTQLFIHTKNPTAVLYNGLLICNDKSYSTVMLQTDSSYEKASLTVKLIINRLYIFDQSLNLLDSFESWYLLEEDDYGAYLGNEHTFTLDNVEDYACKQMAEQQ